MKKYIFLFLFLGLHSVIFAQRPHKFELSKDQFLLDGKPFQIISAEMHPARIPVQYWRHRIKMAKALGCNTIAAYVFWNYHEEQPGKFDFSTENHNITGFIKMAQEEGMWVLLRPGPYVCAEWDFGGLPAWLLKTPDIKLRCMDPVYMQAVTKYVQKLSSLMAPLQVSKGGPILMVQVENEYGSYGNDKKYLETLRKLWLTNGINVPFYTADGPTPFMLEAGSVEGAAIGLDSGSSERDFEEAGKQNPNVPSFSSETYPGWLTHWGEKWARPDTTGLLKEIKFLLDTKRSVNLYVAHGGTNFGYWAGANAFKPTEYQPDITSYDYDAPIAENGTPKPKYFAIRKLISQYVKNIPELPAPIPSIEIPSFKLIPGASLWENLPKALYAPQPKPMEAYGQNSGFMLYRTKLIGHKSGSLTITEPHDYATVSSMGNM
ncbi:beta-galactosidase family protein [Pseudarcicella hirudinis]|uniref:glycoside hydrolase family 35 protein n=1 Tax=Pseudarcicella hirudinis TaxID=1079859 RepID=UPI0035E57389